MGGEWWTIWAHQKLPGWLPSPGFPFPGCLVALCNDEVPAAGHKNFRHDTSKRARSRLRLASARKCLHQEQRKFYLARATHLYLRGLISLPRILPGNSRRPRASCTAQTNTSFHRYAIIFKAYKLVAYIVCSSLHPQVHRTKLVVDACTT